MRRLFDNLVHDLHLPQMPFWMVSGVIIFVVLTWVPLALTARARVTLRSDPRVHLFQDMDAQPKYKEQGYTLLFADGRAMRPPVPGTVARSEILGEPHLVDGYVVRDGEPVYFDTIPPTIEVDERLLLRGRDMYQVYCFPCHGMTGAGDGPVHKRAARLTAAGATGTTWVAPSNLLNVDTERGQLQFGPELYADGKLYNVITHGIRNMPAYGDQIEIRDRWAIVAWVRAIQASQDPAAPPRASAE